ncbi:Rrf2 family transcriptional regulator [Caldimonas sp. KR1-144]|uniref:Rrf2 family transcriptional regulator n=1 Tax=Caldimonas sp. KR1-144 TaxID=3400911 RepID=UPI003C0DF443
MKLTAFTDYALRVLIYLAAQPQRRATIAEIAAVFDVKENHLTKVAHFLGRNGLLHNVRGNGGGLELAREPQAIVVGQVVRLTEGAAMPAQCFGDAPGACRIARQCRLRDALGRAVDAFYAVLDDCTLEDLVHEQPALGVLLRPGRPVARIHVPLP